MILSDESFQVLYWLWHKLADRGGAPIGAGGSYPPPHFFTPMDGRDKGRTRIFGPAPFRKTLEIKSSRDLFTHGNELVLHVNGM